MAIEIQSSCLDDQDFLLFLKTMFRFLMGYNWGGFVPNSYEHPSPYGDQVSITNIYF